jgi:heme exporter protein CcmD
MNWYDSISGYGYYVWSAYGFVILVFSAMMFTASRRLHRIKKKLRQCDES